MSNWGWWSGLVLLDILRKIAHVLYDSTEHTRYDYEISRYRRVTGDDSIMKRGSWSTLRYGLKQ